MSSSTIFDPLRRNRWFVDQDGAQATTAAEDDDLRIVWDLTDYLASGETVSSAAYDDSGAVSSAKSVATPQVIFTLSGIGHTTVTATLSTLRTVDRMFRIYPTSGAKVVDYR